MPEWHLDHIVAEVWDEKEQRWRLVDAELHEDHVDPTDGAVLDPTDLPRDRFITGSAAWAMCRASEADPETFLVSPDLDIPGTRGWPYLMHNLVHDLASLNKHEMLLWEDWGITESRDTITDEQLQLLDQAASVMESPGSSHDDLWRLFERDEFRVPPTVTSYSPALKEIPVQVSITAPI